MSRISSVPSVLFTAITFSGGSVVTADDNEPYIPAPGAEFVRQIDGAAEPHNIPDTFKYRTFFSNYQQFFRTHLLPNLSGQDDAALRAAADMIQSIDEEEATQYREDYRAFCASRYEKDAATLAAEEQRVVSAANERRAGRYKGLLAQLSPSARQTVVEFIDSFVASGIVTSTSNTEAAVAAYPDEYLRAVETRCHVAETGDLPDAIKAAAKKLRRDHARDSIGSSRVRRSEDPR